jgi:putative mycofactocin binding protein MftB
VDLDVGYELDPQVALRPEPFGALAYHYGNRRLSFLRSPDIVSVVQALADHGSAGEALRACRIDESRWPSFTTALATLEASHVIRSVDHAA